MKLCFYTKQIRDDLKFKEVKIVVFRDALSRVSVHQSSGFWQESVSMELPIYQQNTIEMIKVRLCNRHIECHNWKGLH